MTWILSGFCDEASPDLNTQIEVATRAGLSHMDARMFQHQGATTNIADLDIDSGKDYAKRISEANLRVGCLGSAVGKIDITDDFNIDLQRIERLASHAESFGTRSVRVFSYFNKQDKTKNEWREQSLERLGALRERASSLGLVLLLENERHIYGDRLQDVLDLMTPLHQPGLFELIFDFDNYNQSGDDCWDNWQQLHPMVTSFHLKDSTKDCVHVPIGQGAGQAEKILSDALAKGFKGLLSLEPHLAHSDAVMATGPSGSAAMQDTDPVEAFLHGAKTGFDLLSSIGANIQ